MRASTAAGARVLCAAASLLLASACNFHVPQPPGGKFPRSEMVEVPYPPPPARVEVVPPKKQADHVWIDGQWDWDGSEWQWTEGTWTVPPKGAVYFTPWQTERRADGRLFFASSAWRDADGRPLNGPAGRSRCPGQPAGCCKSATPEQARHTTERPGEPAGGTSPGQARSLQEM